VNDHNEQLMWIHTASQCVEAEATTQKTLDDGRTALLFDPSDVNKIVKQCVARWNWKPDVVGKSWIATTVPNDDIVWCSCGSRKPAYWIYDGHGIALCKVCVKCKSQKVKKYRSDIFTQYDADEQIDSDY
jgi:hypothetical protein